MKSHFSYNQHRVVYEVIRKTK